MKKLVFVLFGVLIGVLGSHLIEQSRPDSEMKDKVEHVAKKPNGIITKDRAKELSAGYDSRYKLISNSIDRDDNRSVWFSIAEMEGFLGYTQYEAQNLLDKKYTVNGIRVYLAAYPDKNTDQAKAGYTTVFMVPTYDATISKSSTLPLNTALKIADVPEGSPLNEGEIGDPPSSAYPN
ncbi:hypothetical protein [Formosa sp. L2A11]|uniref:hypothetical protein n=1 Tax=Formosa sp. L2A11 TaxID=2686363 RepID=UPI00131BAACB|nr:hypothetical protein [Formosa sp. L2A11]